jgi:hypothetical protein
VIKNYEIFVVDRLKVSEKLAARHRPLIFTPAGDHQGNSVGISGVHITLLQQVKGFQVAPAELEGHLL